MTDISGIGHSNKFLSRRLKGNPRYFIEKEKII